MSLLVSSHNPFRTPTVTPVPTGATAQSDPFTDSATASSTQSASTSSSATANTPSGSPPEPSSAARGNGSQPEPSVNDLLSEELPPAYTSSPNFYEGEATLEVGPRRPFQQPPYAPQPHQPPSQFPPQSWSIPQQTGPPHGGYYHPGGFAPPPSHASQAQQPTSGPLSDFARDFYHAGGNDGGLMGGGSAQYQTGNPASDPPSDHARYAHPHGPPPPPKDAASSSPTAPNDGKPTPTPVPGHPLLRNGKVLVYPPGHECYKCHNTGYKNHDPSHSCSRCWDKYAKPYVGAITYAPWGSDAATSPTASSSAYSSSSLQRPLPNFRPPQQSLHQSSSSWSGAPPGAASNLQRAATTSRANGYPGAGAGAPPRLIPIAGGAFPPRQWGQLQGPAAGGSVAVMSPGDPRMGGRLCWRCGGRGTTSFLIFDEQTCGICSGVGRTFV
ncbi:uncharacterized protein BXZ73DRAFT_88515 [Epithele typhae]|uniref:uncharacterized protein n=1 Tax=Epithele typhae TaxID=378194 RepID=UPI0020076672|nr:uncharacterized protein BXZ73DRAFT_88515 [Epithele typhae]KAH9940795.1 hypothetical protein BXZ73DRAFT_88515 [Epithele typhae]